MKPPSWAYGLGAGLVLGALTVWLVCLDQRRALAMADQATIASQRQTIAALTRQAAKLDTVYVERTKEKIRLSTRWDTVRTILERVDTLVSRDTLRLVVSVADSAIAACSLVVETCEQRTAVLRSMLGADSAVIAALSRSLARARFRSRLACVAGPGALVIGGSVKVGYASAGCGFRFF